jgi:hypothetical protein
MDKAMTGGDATMRTRNPLASKGTTKVQPSVVPRSDVCRKLKRPHSDFVRHGVTLDQYKQAIRVKIAEYQGYECRVHSITKVRTWWNRRGASLRAKTDEEFPDYPNDLNACQFPLSPEYIEALQAVVGVSIEAQINATALQRCEARILMEANALTPISELRGLFNK